MAWRTAGTIYMSSHANQVAKFVERSRFRDYSQPERRRMLAILSAGGAVQGLSPVGAAANMLANGADVDFWTQIDMLA